MILYLSIFTLIITVSVTFHNYGTNKNSLFLAGYLIPLCLYSMLHYFLFEGNSVLGIAIAFRHFSPFFYLPGAMLYFYTRGTLKNEWQFSKQDLWHLLPFAIGLINVAPYYFISFEEKILYAEKLYNKTNFDQSIYHNLIYPFYISALIRGILFVSYVAFCTHLLYKYWKNCFKELNEISKKNLFKWLCYLNSCALVLAVCILLLTSGFYMKVAVEKSEANSYYYTLIAGLTFCSIPFVTLFYPQVVYGVPISIVNENKKRMEEKQKIVQQNDEMFILSQRVLKYFETAQPYLKKTFSLDDLADELAVPKHQLYSCLNNYIEKRFTQLRTSFRVEHAKKLLLTVEIDSVSLNGIWMESGFSSRTNFFTSFKEETGLTPIEFIQKQAKVQS